MAPRPLSRRALVSSARRPSLSEDLAALNAVRKSIPRDDIKIMPDVARIGGVTGWLHAAGVGAAHGIEMSSHLMPEISAHLLCATPTAHWLEYVDWADAIIEEPLKIRDGMVLTSERVGSGISWDEAKLKRLATI